MTQKATKWFTVQEGETIEACLERMRSAGYQAVERREKPEFAEIDGCYLPVQQQIQFKGRLFG